MDVKQTLRQYWQALTYAQKCFRELDDARNEGLRSPRLDGMPRGGGGNGLDAQVARIDALERREAKAREKALGLAEEIEEMIEGLEDITLDTVRDLLTVDTQSWLEDVANIKEFYAQVGDHVPAIMHEELAALESRLNASK